MCLGRDIAVMTGTVPPGQVEDVTGHVWTETEPA